MTLDVEALSSRSARAREDGSGCGRGAGSGESLTFEVHCPPGRIRRQRAAAATFAGWLLLCGFGDDEGTKGMVASASPLASAIGVAVLERGGNAVDAAVATAFALAVVEPYSAGVGGGGFMLYRDAASGQTVVVDYREIAPRKAHRDMYVVDGKVDPELSLRGYGAVAVPGMVPGLAAAQAKHGKLKLADVLGGAIELASTGFRVDPRFVRRSIEQRDLLAADPEAARIFLRDGQPYPVGAVLVQKDLAATLRALAREGPRLFTHGRVAQAMAAGSKQHGGALSLEDLQGFSARWREPLVRAYKGHQVITMPPPSSGGTHLLQMLALLELDEVQRGRRRHGRTWNDVHVLVESMRLAYADRAQYMGDPGFVDVPVEALLSASYLTQRYALIHPGRALPEVTAGDVRRAPAAEPMETTHLCVIDAEGNAVSLTQTVNYAFGAGVVAKGTGVLLNNEMDDFSAAPGVPNAYGLIGGEANSIQPGKIPLSSMTPTIVAKDGKVRLIVGAPGGSTIITTVLQAILNVIDEGMSPGRAIAMPRLHHQWMPPVLQVEEGALDALAIRALTTFGHQVNLSGKTWGNASIIGVEADGKRRGAADPRGVGAAVAQR